MIRETQLPPSVVSRFLSAAQPTVKIYLFVNNALLQLLHFLRINFQKGANRLKGDDDFCGRNYKVQYCFPKGTISLSGMKTQSVKNLAPTTNHA